MEKENSNNQSQFVALQLLLALVGVGITFVFVFKMIALRGVSLRHFIHFQSFIFVVFLGSFGLIFNRGRFIGLNYFVAGIISNLIGVYMLYKNMIDPGQIPPALAVASLSTFYGSLLLIIMTITFWLVHKKCHEESNTQNLQITALD